MFIAIVLLLLPFVVNVELARSRGKKGSPDHDSDLFSLVDRDDCPLHPSKQRAVERMIASCKELTSPLQE